MGMVHVCITTVKFLFYNVLGQQIQTLPQGMRKTGNYTKVIYISRQK